MNAIKCVAGLAIAGWTGTCLGSGVTAAGLQEVVVSAERIVLAGNPRAASEGTVLREQLEHRPLLRTGEMLEVVPGLIVTQHTGDGKANQYFLRGFNLDHGTDFSTRVEGMAVNMPTHGHGQGYMDLNFVIPELIERVVYHKGTYYPELGNFSAAGAADFAYLDRIEPMLTVTGGEDAYLRALTAGSVPFVGGNLLYGLEYESNDGPWDLPENLDKANGVLRYSRATAGGGFSVDLMGYDGDWDSTDQVPRRAIRDGTIDRFGFIDPTNGGASHRYSLSMQGFSAFGERRLDYNAWAMDYELQLYSNFTYALDQQDGDQFEQFDDRRVWGGGVTWTQPFAAAGRDWTWRAGAEVRSDDIAPVGLYLTTARERRETVREDDVRQTLVGLWTGLETRWTGRFRTEIGARFDAMDYAVSSSLAANSGSGSDDIVSPKLSMVFGPFRETEFFAAAGRGYHANDIRGATITVDPADGVTPVEAVDPLVAADGMEVGLRTALIPRAQLSLALWQLEVDSELLFVGDGGATEPSRPSRRRGVEVGLYARPLDGWIVDADFAWSKPRFRDDDPAGDRVPGAVERVASVGVTYDAGGAWFGGTRLRYLGPAALIEDGSVRAPHSTLVNVEGGRRFGERLRVKVGVYNLLDSDASDIQYYYESRLPGEAAPVEDIHLHPVEPRTLRLTVEMTM
jgi:hypothetical protein